MKQNLLAYADDAYKLARIAAVSGCFGSEGDNDKSTAIMCLKIMMGMEYGISPTIAMKAIYVIKGNLTMSYQLMEALIKRSGKYDFTVKSWTDKGCTLLFTEDGKPCGGDGVSEYLESHAKTAGLLTRDMWAKNPRAMYFARALSHGANAYCAEVFGGPIYAPADFCEEKEDNGQPIREFMDFSGEAEKKKPPSKTAAGTGATEKGAGTTSQAASLPDPKPVSAAAAQTPSSSAGAADSTPSTTATTTPASAAESTKTKPTDAQLAEILQAGVANGWTEDQLEGWVIGFLESKGVDVSEADQIFATWTWDHVTEAINFVANNKPA